MRFTKVLGLAAVAAVAAMAFIGVSSASAVDQITLCKTLVKSPSELCPSGQLYPAGAKLLGLATDPTLETSIGTILCEDGTVTAESLASVGSPLGFRITALEFGVLPTPKLGTGCTGPCKGSPTGENVVHTVVPFELSEVEVNAKDEFFLKGTGLAFLLGCPIVGTCAYRGENILVPVKLHPNAGTHPLAHEQGGVKSALASIDINTTLSRVTTHGGSPFCPATGTWNAVYKIYLIDPPNAGESTLGYLALDIP